MRSRSDPFVIQDPFVSQDPFVNQEPFVIQDPFVNQDPFVYQDPFVNQNPFLGHTGLIIGLYGVVFHGEDACDVQNFKAPPNNTQNLTKSEQI